MSKSKHEQRAEIEGRTAIVAPAAPTSYLDARGTTTMTRIEYAVIRNGVWLCSVRTRVEAETVSKALGAKYEMVSYTRR